jgi:Family of unknown function (DUF6056)
MNSHPSRTALGFSLFLPFGAVIAAFWTVTLAWKGRFISDDVCYAVQARDLGPIGLLKQQYFHWTGRFSFALLEGLVMQLSPTVARIIPIVILLTLSLGLASIARTTARLFGSAPLLLRDVSGGLIAAACLVAVTADRFQVFIWLTGSLTYSLPIALATCAIAAIISDTNVRWRWILGSVLVFIAAGCSDAFAVVQVIALGALVLVVDRRFRRRVSLLVVVAFTALAAVGLAPGNATREATGHPLPLGSSILQGAKYALVPAGRLLAEHGLIVLVLSLGGAFLGGQIAAGDTTSICRKGARRLLFVALVTGLIGSWATQTLSFLGIGRSLFSRAQSAPLAATLVAAILFGFELAVASPSRAWMSIASPVTSILMALALPVMSARTFAADLPPMTRFAHQSDAMTAALKAAPTGAVVRVSASKTAMGLNFVADHADGPDWGAEINRCIATHAKRAGVVGNKTE